MRVVRKSRSPDIGVVAVAKRHRPSHPK
jgi:hypothetical protein